MHLQHCKGINQILANSDDFWPYIWPGAGQCINFGFFLCNNKVLNVFAMLQMNIKVTNAFATCKGTALILASSDDLWLKSGKDKFESAYVLSLQKVWRTLSSKITPQYLNEIPVKAAVAVERKNSSPVDDEDSLCCHQQRQGFGEKTDERTSLPGWKQFKMAQSCFELPLEAAVAIHLVTKATWLAWAGLVQTH